MNPTVRTGTPPPDAPHIPVAIVGAGACGLVAAIALRDAGVDCVLLERDAQPSGSTALSSGFIPAAGTSMQRAAGIQDSPAQFAADIQAKAHGTAAAHLVAAYSERIGAVLDALQARHGITFEVLDGFLYPGHSVRRMHAVPQKTGAALVAQLERAATAAGADIVTQATGARALGGRGRAHHRRRLRAARRARGAAALRRADPGLQRLWRQPGDGARAAARDARGAVCRSHR